MQSNGTIHTRLISEVNANNKSENSSRLSSDKKAIRNTLPILGKNEVYTTLNFQNENSNY